ncbi:unnamed protein product [Zymoseptoria tritici ST99CH_1A5]|uniref:Uncharacterized protein n=2 Tax=Zymoseptoria tritici TaxID=1047171 RepID=A0A2H1FMJ8_ZYMTR|nr:unnamed protein product [Zymoseptoria tritici ST99CH_1E4]SMR44632.1 unnamed protein product [Zymoseptoria tritici ST99CH_3D1]SMY19795.1 unnamed protein product [Zymoseptoria tritici ST99CH_1A5]
MQLFYLSALLALMAPTVLGQDDKPWTCFFNPEANPPAPDGVCFSGVGGAQKCGPGSQACPSKDHTCLADFSSGRGYAHCQWVPPQNPPA